MTKILKHPIKRTSRSGVSICLFLLIVTGTLFTQIGGFSPFAAASSSYSIVISSQGGGTTSPNSGTHSYSVGQTITLTATANTGWIFDHWIYQGSQIVTRNPLPFVSNWGGAVFTLIAVFTSTQPQQFTLNLITIGQGSILVSPNKSTYSMNDQVQISATPLAGWSFNNWSGAVSSTQNPLTLTMNNNKVVTATFTQIQSMTAGSADYIVYVSGSTYYVKSVSQNTIVSKQSDFGALINSLNSIIRSSDVVLFQNGVYIAYTTPNLTVSGVTLTGEDNTIIQASNSLTGYLFKVNTITNGVTIQKLIFDANYNSNISPAIIVCGSYTTVQYCTIKNVIQYGLLAYGAQNFQFLHNTIIKAQYGIATGGSSSSWSGSGLIAYNTIKDCRDVCVKLRWSKDVTVVGNDIDTAYLTWGTSSANNGLFGTSISTNSPISGCVGISFYEADGPVVNNVVKDNIIYDSKQNYKTCGIEVDPDISGSSTSSSGQVIINNQIKATYYGILARSTGGIRIGISQDGSVHGNTISNVRGDGIVLGWTAYNASGAKLYGNSVTNSGIYGLLISSGTNSCSGSGNTFTGSLKANIVNNGSSNSIN